MRRSSLQAPEGFRRLSDMLAGVRVEETLQTSQERPAHDREPNAAELSALEEAAVRDLRLFNAHVCESVEAAVEVLLNDIAATVLARELQIAPADIGAIVMQVLHRYAHEQPLRVRVSPSDAPRVTSGIPVVADETLREGDAILELRDGSVDASLGVRLESVLQAAAG